MYIIINVSYEGICVEFGRKNNPTVFLLSNSLQVLKSFVTDPLNIIFDEFGSWLLGYRIKFSCLSLTMQLEFPYMTSE